MTEAPRWVLSNYPRPGPSPQGQGAQTGAQSQRPSLPRLGPSPRPLNTRTFGGWRADHGGEGTSLPSLPVGREQQHPPQEEKHVRVKKKPRTICAKKERIDMAEGTQPQPNTHVILDLATSALLN